MFSKAIYIVNHGTSFQPSVTPRVDEVVATCSNTFTMQVPQLAARLVDAWSECRLYYTIYILVQYGIFGFSPVGYEAHCPEHAKSAWIS